MDSVNRRELIAKVHQNPADGTAARLTVAENLALAMLRSGQARIRPLVNKYRMQYVKDILKHLDIGLEAREHTMIQNLSGGQRQALAIHMTALRNPKVLLLDEHTAALDPDRAQKIMDLTLWLWKEKTMTVLMVTHDLNEALRYGDRLICMSHGRIVYDVKGEEKSKLLVPDLFDIFMLKKPDGFVPDSSFMLIEGICV
jgi:putative tryptophan/tyrosine transport system ATP-binding protein